MSMSLQPSSYPPHRNSSSTRISPAEALSNISAYLELSTTTPSLHPDALLTENGPQFASNAATGGIILSLLRRLEKGLQGERMGGDVTLQGMLPGADDRPPGSRSERRKRKREIETDEDGVTGSHDGQPEAPRSGDKQARDGVQEVNDEGVWQDMESYQRSQNAAQQGEIGKRSNAVRDGGKVPKVKKSKKGKEPAQKDELAVVKPVAEYRRQGETVDKEARKQSKKKRAKQQKIEREAAKRKEKREARRLSQQSG